MTVILTGAARCIGRGAARAPAETGAKVPVTALTNKYLWPPGRMMNIREAGIPSLYLVSGASNYMTGETIYIDGGVSHA